MKKIALLACLFFIFLPAQLAKACEPYPEYWYAESITFETRSLPENVSIYSTDPEVTPRAAFWLYNQNEAPIFILPLNDYHQVIIATAFPASVGEMALETVNAQNSPKTLEMDQLMVLDNSLQDPNPVSLGRPAPDTLQIPEPQHSELFLVYHTQVITVPFTVTYSINPHNSVADCQRWYQEAARTEEAQAQLLVTADAGQGKNPDQMPLPIGFVIALVIPGVIIIFLLARKHILTRVSGK